MNSSIKERIDNDLAHRQRTVEEWAQSINNNRMHIRENSFIGSQLNPEELMTRRSISSVARTTQIAHGDMNQSLAKDRALISNKHADSFIGGGDSIKSKNKNNFVIEVDFDKFSFTNKNSSIAP